MLLLNEIKSWVTLIASSAKKFILAQQTKKSPQVEINIQSFAGLFVVEKLAIGISV